MRAWLRAGDQARIVDPSLSLDGEVREVVLVRRLAADAGYELRGVDGLLSPQRVELAAEREHGNPCRQECEATAHAAMGFCPHCTGLCAAPYGECSRASIDYGAR